MSSQFISKAIAKHGNAYDYSLVDQCHSKQKITIICPTHGSFKQEPYNHLAGQGCPVCAKELRGSYRKLSIQTFISRSIATHGVRYDYSLVNYITNRQKVDIICKEHGIFKQQPDHHMAGRGCTLCGYESNSKFFRATYDDFIARSIAVHGDRYNYFNVSYITNAHKVTIGCKDHGDFSQIPADHWDGHGCPECTHPLNVSSGEQELHDYLASLVPVIKSDRKMIKPYEIDCLIESKSLGVEYCGIYYHSDKFKANNYHLAKLKKANSVGINLIQIFDDEWNTKKDIVKSILANKLGYASTKIYARKTILKTVPTHDAKLFLVDNHIQGYASGNIHIGLYHNEELVMLATFSNGRTSMGNIDDDWFEMVRLCSKKYTTVVGGFSKVIKFFKDAYQPKGIKTYCDKRYFDGKGYETVGFIRSHDTNPNYHYVKGSIRYSKYLFQKNKMKDKLKAYDPDKSERENMIANNYLRIFDCGLIVFKMEFKI